MRFLKGLSFILFFNLAFQSATAGCPGFQITKGATNPLGLTSFSVPTIAEATYSWTGTDGLTIRRGQGTNRVWVSGTCGTLSITATCGSFFSCSDTYQVVSLCCDPNLDPVSVYISGDFALDTYETGVFYANPSGGGGNYTYRWYRSDTNNGQSVVGLSSSYGAQYPNPGQYWVKVEVWDQCGLTAVSSKFVYVGCGTECEQ